MADTITIAVSKGRIFQETMPFLSELDIYPEDDPETSRKLVLKTNQKNIRIIIIRATDVPTYVEYGVNAEGHAEKILEKVKNLGDLGDLVNVKSGYGRNFLVPQGKAVFAGAGHDQLPA